MPKKIKAEYHRQIEHGQHKGKWVMTDRAIEQNLFEGACFKIHAERVKLRNAGHIVLDLNEGVLSLESNFS